MSLIDISVATITIVFILGTMAFDYFRRDL